ncbi:hypothetical protein OKW43_005466 [Paraburkholderia sp. WC7.3g]
MREAAALLGARHTRGLGDVVAQLPLEPLGGMRLGVDDGIDAFVKHLKLLVLLRAIVTAQQQRECDHKGYRQHRDGRHQHHRHERARPITSGLIGFGG